MIRKGAVNRMIFPVNITGHCASNRDEFRPRHNGKKPSFGHCNLEYLIKQETALTFENSFGFVKRHYLVKFQSGYDPVCQRCISIASAIASGNKMLIPANKFPELIGKNEGLFEGIDRRIISPVGDLLFHLIIYDV